MKNGIESERYVRDGRQNSDDIDGGISGMKGMLKAAPEGLVLLL